MPLEQKYTCPDCGYEDTEPGTCPSCEIDLKKVCQCGSGDYAEDCCEIEAGSDEEEDGL